MSSTAEAEEEGEEEDDNNTSFLEEENEESASPYSARSVLLSAPGTAVLIFSWSMRRASMLLDIIQFALERLSMT